MQVKHIFQFFNNTFFREKTAVAVELAFETYSLNCKKSKPYVSIAHSTATAVLFLQEYLIVYFCY